MGGGGKGGVAEECDTRRRSINSCNWVFARL